MPGIFSAFHHIFLELTEKTGTAKLSLEENVKITKKRTGWVFQERDVVYQQMRDSYAHEK